MRNAITRLVLALGRYAVLPVVAVAATMFAAWLIAIDYHPRMAFATSLVVLPVTTGAVFLAYGLLLLPGRRNTQSAVEQAAAPGLWAIWNELDRTFAVSRRTLLIDADMNASIGERRQFLGLFRPQFTLTIGLPLLIVLDERAVRAVIAHEVAHAALQHTSGAVNLNEFMAAAENIFEYADPETTITGRIAAALLNALIGWLYKEYQVLSYQNELSADRQSAECVGCHEAARALVLSHAMIARMDEIVFTPLEKELLGAIRAPTPPLARIFSQLDMIRLPDQVEAAALAAMAHQEDSTSMHPPLHKRLANLGFSEIPKIDPVQTSAVHTLLSDHAVKDLVARFDNQWSKRATEQVDIYQ